MGRGFNIYADGVLLAQDFSPPETQGGVNTLSSAALVSAELLTHRHALGIVLTVNGRTRPDFTDPNAILDGVTLEILNQVARPTLGLTKEADGKLTITTDSTLQVADTVTGIYTNLPVKSVTIDPKTAGAQKFYRGARP